MKTAPRHLRSTRSLTAALSLALVTALLVGSTVATDAHPSPRVAPPPTSPPNGVTLAVSPRPPIAGEMVVARGRVDTRVRRPISIQVWTGRAWRVQKSGLTTVKGEYTLTFPVAASISVRALAPRAKIRGKYYPQRNSSTRTINVVSQTSTVEMLPPIAQPGALPASVSDAKNVLSATFTPARTGRKAVAQLRVGKRWRTVDTASVDSAGRVTFRVAQALNGANVDYRVTLLGARGAPPVTTPSRGTTTSFGPLVWQDEFNGNTLGPDWMLMDPDYGKVANRRCSKGSMDAVKVKGGTLNLQVKPDPDRKGKVCRAYGHSNVYQLNGTVSTRQIRYFRYGFAAARIKFHRLRGQHSAFWLTTDQVNDGTEVDVSEWFGKQTKTMANYIYVRRDGKKKRKYGGAIAELDSYLTGQGDTWYGRYHVFSLERTPHSYTFRIDGKVTFTTTKAATKKKMFLWLTNLSGDYEIHFMDPAEYPQTTSVDWVRLWAPLS